MVSGIACIAVGGGGIEVGHAGLSDYWPGSTLLGKLHSYQRCRKKQFTFPTITNIYTICTAYVRAMEKASHAQAGTVLYSNFYTVIFGVICI